MPAAVGNGARVGVGTNGSGAGIASEEHANAIAANVVEAHSSVARREGAVSGNMGDSVLSEHA
ncbi:MAG: hypothetical protein IH868_10250 [Chloroflexi bacterium]|nr:hypothetical protein [Chloroflexota bacterium]